MKGRWFLLFAALLMLAKAAACADAYILHTPAQKQVQEDEALEIACDFLHALTGVEITGIYKVADGMKIKDKAEAFFGPGYQWGADTNDDCWVLVIRNESTVVRPWVVIHGTTGEVLYWQYSDQTTQCTYINCLPGEGQLSHEDAVEIAMDRFTRVINKPFSMDEGAVYLSSSFGNADNWNIDMGTALVWNIHLSYINDAEQYGYSAYIDAESGEILREQRSAQPMSYSKNRLSRVRLTARSGSRTIMPLMVASA